MTHEPDTRNIDALAAIIREADGGHRLGADALAAAILAHRNSRWGPAPAPAAFPGISDDLIRMLIRDVQEQLVTSTDQMLIGRPFDPVPNVRARLLEILQLAAEDDLSKQAPLLWLLWNHLGSQSPVGQVIREYLGMGRFERMTEEQIEAADHWSRENWRRLRQQPSAPQPEDSQP